MEHYVYIVHDLRSGVLLFKSQSIEYRKDLQKHAGTEVGFITVVLKPNCVDLWGDTNEIG